MGENFLNPVGASFPSLGSPQRISVSSQGGRNKVQLKPGHSLMDWIRLGRSGKDLTGVGGRRLDVTPEELGKHNTEKDCWLALRGKVYNVTSYLEFHPGGVDELMRGAGKDATALFDEIHKWVNAESMLEKCLVGRYKVENQMLKNALLRKGSKTSENLPNGGFLAPATPPLQTPRFDWYQSGQTVSVIMYTKCPEIGQDDIIVDLQGRTLLASMHIKQSVYTSHIELEREVSLDCKMNISGDRGKVELVFEKSLHDVQWSSIGKHLNQHNTYVSYNDFNPAYRDCTIEAVESVTHDTRLYTVCLPPGTRMTVPVGHHVHLKHDVEGVEVVRSYTVVLPSLQPDCQDPRVEQGRALYLMVKVYPQGVLTPWLGNLKPGERIPISSHQGTFKLSQLQECSHLVMFAAGTGFTPMVRLIYHTLVENTQSKCCVKLLFFNKKEEDILWNDKLCALAECNDRFTFTNCLSEAGDSWTGLRGRITKQLVEQYLPPLSENDHPLICVCGPTPFTNTVITFAKELGHKEHTHAFQG